MSILDEIEEGKYQSRSMEPAVPNDDDLGPLKLLPGHWHGAQTGWNMIALPHATPPPPAGFNYRVLMNQYTEDLVFRVVDKAVPNRGIRFGNPTVDTDQFLIALDYEQTIAQVAAEDSPDSGKAAPDGTVIHHEPGLWVHMLNERTNDLDIARLATVPHGDSVLGLGRSVVTEAAEIPELNGLPFGGERCDHSSPYLAPYKHFIDNPFFGTVPQSLPNFPGFHPLDLNAILRFANQDVEIERTTVLEVDTDLQTGGIVNIPFIVKQANAASMRSTFWIHELRRANGDPGLRLQYSQTVMLDFFRPRPDGMPGRLRWPHVSIATLDKQSP